jgi:segregation and condensation protein B
VSRKKHKKQRQQRDAAGVVAVEAVAEGSGPHEAVMADDGTLAVAAVGPAAPEADALVVDAAAETETGTETETETGTETETETVTERVAEAQAVAEMVAVADMIDGDGAGDAAADGPQLEVVAASEDAGEPAEGEVGEALGAELPTSANTMDAAQLKNLVEALVFASDKPVTLQRLRQLTRVADVKRLEASLAELAVDYTTRGLVLQQVSGGYQFRTQTRYSTWVQQLIAGRPVRLSRAQLETLAIVAYRQPITRPEIDDIRGVDSSATLKLLLDRALIRTLGQKEEVGRPMLYGTTREFLDFFSLGDLRELPTLREYSELTAESRRVVSDRLGDVEPPPAATTVYEAPPEVMAEVADEVEAASDAPSDPYQGDEPGERPDASELAGLADDALAMVPTDDVVAADDDSPEPRE